MQASTLMAGVHLNAMLLKFVISEDRQVTLWGHKGLAWTKLGLDEDFMPAQQACKLELWLLFKEAKAVNKHAFWHAIELFVDNT
ncbi:unnamed protein product [Sphagnum jensenii]|uniref:Uncharacterized protein n=1 Tax=Sphagnum jensenii TaxID=128206 RepID=A0ABP0V7P3_9BRYO